MNVDIFSTARTYDLICADPPWKQKKGGRKAARPKSSGGALAYRTISMEEIKGHLERATALCEPDAVLFLWTIDKYLFEAQRMAEELGWKLHARMIWNKVTGIPAAFTVRFGHEYLLYMYRGKLPPVARDERGKIHTVFTERVRRHSQKPEISFEIMERLYPDARRLELYARREREGWDCFGDEIETKESDSE